jgi:hypothetical protein
MIATMNHINAVHDLISREIHFSIILPSTSRSPKWTLPLRFFDIFDIFHVCYEHRPILFPCFPHSTNIWHTVQRPKVTVTTLSVASCYFLPLWNMHQIRWKWRSLENRPANMSIRLYQPRVTLKYLKSRNLPVHVSIYRNYRQSISHNALCPNAVWLWAITARLPLHKETTS